MVKPMMPQPITDMGYGGMDFLKKFRENLKNNKSPVAQNAMQLTAMNGDRRFDTGELSQGAQELAQKVEQNEKPGVIQNITDRVRQFLSRPLIPDTSVEDPITGKKINPDLLKLLNNRPDLRQRFNETGSIYTIDMP